MLTDDEARAYFESMIQGLAEKAWSGNHGSMFDVHKDWSDTAGDEELTKLLEVAVVLNPTFRIGAQKREIELIGKTFQGVFREVQIECLKELVLAELMSCFRLSPTPGGGVTMGG